MNNPLVTVIIVNWNGNGVIQDCLESVVSLSYKPVEILVVDNNSTDASRDFLERRNDIVLVSNPENYGFAKGNNIGFSQAKGKYIATLNNDMVVEPSWLNDPVRYLETDESVGIIGCRQMNFFNRTAIDELYHTITKGLNFYSYGRGERYAGSPEYSKPGFVISASGGSSIYRKKMLDDLGGFDERLFAYYEDVDLALRAFLAEWKCLYVPTATVYHRGSFSFKRNPEKSFFYGQRNRYVLLYKYFPMVQILRHLPWIAGNEFHILRTMCCDREKTSLYFRTTAGIIKAMRNYRDERKTNVPLFKKKMAMFSLFRRKGIVFQKSVQKQDT